MSKVDRRSFLKRSSMTAAAAGLVAMVPGGTALLGAMEGEAPEVDTQAVDGSATTASMDEPVVAHIRDLSTGEMGIYQGTREVILKDPGLAARLFRAAP